MASLARSHRYRSWNINMDDGGDTSLLDTSASSTVTMNILTTKEKRLFSFWSVIFILLVVGLLFLVGFFFGYFVRESAEQALNLTATHRQFDEAKLEAIHGNIMYFLSRDPDQIKTFYREFGTADPLTNSVLEKKLEHTVYEQLLDYKFDSVDVEEYSVVVTYPDPERPNRLEVLNQSGSVLANFSLNNSATRGSNHGPVIKTVGVNDRYAKFPYVAFTQAGSAEGGLLFGHYGRQSDLLQLKHHGIDITNHLLLLRLGEISVNQKVSVAEQAGASGVLLYWDPADGATDAPDNSSHIPYASAKPENGGDLPKIPVQTVSASVASWLLGVMEGEVVPPHWRGDLNAVYVLGVAHNESNSFKLTSYNQKEEQAVRNVIGSIHGYMEPDRYVLIGAPRTGFPGSCGDAVLATSMLLQLARSLEYVRELEQWIPQRGIKLISWGGHEFSQAGKMEYIKANSHLLGRRAIAYFDLRQMTLGNHSMNAMASPGFFSLIRKAAARVPDPTNSERTIADRWASPAEMKVSLKKQSLYTCQTDEQQNPFLQQLGIPEISLQYMGRHKSSCSSVKYMAALDVQHHFKYHIAVGRVVSLAALHLVDDAVLPISLRDYAEDLQFVLWQTSGELKHCSMQMQDLETEVSAAEDLMRTTAAFTDFIKIHVQNTDSLGIRSANQIKMMFERIFVDTSHHKRHLLYPETSDGQIKRLSELCRVAKFTNSWVEVHSYVTALHTALQEAARCL